MDVERFGETVEGEAVQRVTLRGGDLTASVLTYGGVLQDLRLGGMARRLSSASIRSIPI
jgi:aldose 1-epimerase